MKRLITYLLLFIQPVALFSQIQFSASAPRIVSVGEQFELVYSINVQPDNFILPDINDFEVRGGPSTSTSSSIQIINGKMTKDETYSYTYFLRTVKEGKFTIPAAVVSAGGQSYRSNAVSVEVVKKSSTGQQQQGEQQQGGGLTTDDVYVKVLLNKSSVYQGENIIATVKLYTRVNVIDYDRNFAPPDFTGFFKQNIDVPQLRSLTRENIDGQIYNTGTLAQFVLTPASDGTLTISPFELMVVVRQTAQRSTGRSIWDDFFGSVNQDVQVKIKSQPLKVNVKPLPANKPPAFSGAVGDFSLNASINKNKVKANEGLTLKVTLSGQGNIKMVNVPKLDIPESIEKYDPKEYVNIKNTQKGSSGSKTFEYLIIPRFAGEYIIPPVTFTYFDPADKKYKTLKSEEFIINVEKGEEGTNAGVITGLSKEEVKFIGKDIYFIKQNTSRLKKADYSFFGSTAFYLYYIVASLVFFIIVLVARNTIKRNANIALVKNRKANRLAQKRLKLARKYLRNNEKGKFYEEMSRALWGYISDKLSIPLSELTVENARTAFLNKNVEADITNQMFEIISECEYARYAPAQEAMSILDYYEKAVSVISKIEGVI